MAKTGNWNIIDLIRYLVQVRNDLTTEEVTRLESSAIFAKDSALSDTIRYCACDLYAPIEIFQQLRLPVIQWDEKSRWRDDSDEGDRAFKFSFHEHNIVSFSRAIISPGFASLPPSREDSGSLFLRRRHSQDHRFLVPVWQPYFEIF